MKIHVKPLRGRVIDPLTRQPLPKEGKQVAPSRYWKRRELVGDVEVSEASKPRTKKAKREAEPKE